jgi:hypothetical protein
MFKFTSYVFIELVMSQCPTGVTFSKDKSVVGLALETVLRDKICQVFVLNLAQVALVALLAVRVRRSSGSNAHRVQERI